MLIAYKILNSHFLTRGGKNCMCRWKLRQNLYCIIHKFHIKSTLKFFNFIKKFIIFFTLWCSSTLHDYFQHLFFKIIQNNYLSMKNDNLILHSFHTLLHKSLQNYAFIHDIYCLYGTIYFCKLILSVKLITCPVLLYVHT